MQRGWKPPLSPPWTCPCLVDCPAQVRRIGLRGADGEENADEGEGEGENQAAAPKQGWKCGRETLPPPSNITLRFIRRQYWGV